MPAVGGDGCDPSEHRERGLGVDPTVMGPGAEHGRGHDRPETVRANRNRILAAIELGLSNSKLEGLNSKIRLINHRGYGHGSAAALIAMIYLCCGGLTIQLPTER